MMTMAHPVWPPVGPFQLPGYYPHLGSNRPKPRIAAVVTTDQMGLLASDGVVGAEGTDSSPDFSALQRAVVHR